MTAPALPCWGRSALGPCQTRPVYSVAVGPEVTGTGRSSEDLVLHACGRHLSIVVHNTTTDDGLVIATVRKIKTPAT